VEEKHYLQSLLSEVETIDHTTRRLLEFSLSRSNDRDKYVSKQEINDVVAKAAEQYKVAVTVQIDSSLPMGHDDLRLIIDSLLSNVSKHSGEHHPPARVRVSARKSMYILSCQNKGKKFTKNALVHATKRGFTTSGSGIGLSLCAELVENLRGNIKLLNNASGVEVRINIPRIR
jgi:signal transduction histidine kinase